MIRGGRKPRFSLVLNAAWNSVRCRERLGVGLNRFGSKLAAHSSRLFPLTLVTCRSATCFVASTYYAYACVPFMRR